MTSSPPDAREVAWRRSWDDVRHALLGLGGKVVRTQEAGPRRLRARVWMVKGRQIVTLDDRVVDTVVVTASTAETLDPVRGVLDLRGAAALLLLAARPSPDQEAAVLAVAAVGRRDDAAVLDALRAAAPSPERAVRDAFLRAAARLSAMELLPEVERIATTDADADLRELAAGLADLFRQHPPGPP